VINDNIILIHFPEWVTLYFIEPSEFAASHQMTAITHFALSDQSVVALAGPCLKDSNINRIIVKTVSSQEYLLSTTIIASVQYIAISKMGERVAVCSSDSIVRVWDVPSKTLIFAKFIRGTTGVEFKKENILLVKGKEGEESIDLGEEIAGKKDLTVEISNDNTVAVYSAEGELMASLSLPCHDEKIVSASISSNG
jgi:WD40 repeat protein